MKTFTGAILILSTIVIDMNVLQAIGLLFMGGVAFFLGLADD